MTKYEFVANQLADRINNNEFKHTKKIPTEDQLMQEYNVSKNTIILKSATILLVLLAEAVE